MAELYFYYASIICGNDRYVSMCRRYFKQRFYAGGN